MKILLYLILTLTFISCNQGSANSKVSQNGVADIKTTDNKDIFDAWAMCSTVSNGTMIQMNVCPIIVFTNSGKGFVEMNSLITESFYWKLEKKNMKIQQKQRKQTGF